MSRPAAVALLGVSLGSLVVFHLAGGTAPPLYDGLCTQPAYDTFGSSPTPASVTKTIAAAQQFPTTIVTTPEPSPQAQVILEAGTFPAGSAVTISITAVAPPAVAPAGGMVEGNVYEITATSAAGVMLQPAANTPATVTLASPISGGPQLVLERFDGSGWTRLTTVQAGCGTAQEAASPSLGRFALVAIGTTTTPGPGPGGAGSPVLVVVLIVGAIVVILSGALGLARRART